MACNCSQGQNPQARVLQRNPNPSPRGVPQVAASRVQFYFVDEDGEHAFDKLSDAKKRGAGTAIKTRRIR